MTADVCLPWAQTLPASALAHAVERCQVACQERSHAFFPSSALVWRTKATAGGGGWPEDKEAQAERDAAEHTGQGNQQHRQGFRGVSSSVRPPCPAIEAAG